MRYPRILYISPQLSGSIQDMPHTARQPHRSSQRKARNGTRSFLTTSLTKSRGSKAVSPRLRSEACYLKPTVRLVQAFHNRSPEPRVYLPEEIILPPCSPTLVNSSGSDLSMYHVDLNGVPPRVYLPPVFPELFEPIGSDQEADLFYTTPNSNGATSPRILYMPPSSPHPPGLSSSPPAPQLTGFYDTISASEDVLTFPFTPDPIQGSASALFFDKTESDTSYIPISPELSPPPLAYAHPILVRRALSPWRRRSPVEPSHDATPVPVAASANDEDSKRRHRPSVPSRLRYFITRSASASLSGSQTPSTPASSLGTRSAMSAKSSKQSPKRDVLDAPDSGRAGVDAKSDASIKRLGVPLNTHTSPVSESDADELLQRLGPDQGTHTPPGEALPQYDYLANIPRQPSTAEDAWRESQVSTANAEEDVEEETLTLREECELASSSFPAPDTGPHALVGLGLRVASEPVPASRTRRASAPAGGVRASASTGLFNIQTNWLDGPDVQQSGGRPRQSSMSLRTVLSGWMNPRREVAQSLEGEERGNNVMMDGNLADESVEVMVMGRWEGLDSI